MVFSSTIFLSLFLPIVMMLYFLARDNLRNYVLLGASLFFYAWGEPKTIWTMLVLILLSWYIALLIDRQEGKARKLWLGLGIAVNLSALFFYKYWMFFLENVNLLSEVLSFSKLQVPTIALPIGISFYIFQIVSYLIDVYRKIVPAQPKLSSLAMYISLFPQLIAGPIVRYQTIEEDLHNRQTNMENIYIGARRFVFGLAKKVLIADNMAVIADKIFDAPIETVPCGFAWLGAVAYALQIFYDFSGYSDMAIGLGRIFNFRFLENFNYPYCSTSVQEFWRRWHISLSSWFKDYLYIPLGGNRKGNIRTVVNCYVVFGLCGLWHGATWNFVIWGLYHGTMLMFEKLGLSKIIQKFPVFLSNIYVWLFAIIGWVIFRTENLSHAWDFLKVMFDGNAKAPLTSFYRATEFISYSNVWILILGILFSYPIFEQKYQTIKFSRIDTFVVCLLFLVTYVFAMTSTFSPFIYFRF